MKTKHLLFLVIVLGLLAAAIFIKSRQKPPELATEEFVSLDLSFEVPQVESVLIAKKNKGKEERVELVKKDGAWTIPTLWNSRADKEKVETFFSEILKSKGEERGRGKNLFSDFGISDEEAFHVTLSGGGKSLLDFFIGTKKAGYESFFIRKAGSEAIFLSESQLLTQMGIYGELKEEIPKSDGWASLDFIRFDTGSIQSLKLSRFETDKETVTVDVAKSAGSWKFNREYPFPIDGAKIAQYLGDLKSWPAQKVLDPKAKDYGWAKPLWQMKAVRDGGDELTITFVPGEDANAYAMQVSTEPVVYAYPKYYLENMDITDGKFFANNPLQIEMDKIEEIVVHADKQDLTLKPLENKAETVKNYLETLKQIQFDRLILDSKEQGNFSGKYSLSIKKTAAQPSILEVSDDMISNEKKEYSARIKGSNPIVAIPEAQFQQLFNDLNRFLEVPAEEPAK